MCSVSDPVAAAIDHDQLLKRVMDNTALATRLLNKFVASSPTELDEMETAARLGDARLLASLAHRHRGTAATMAASRIEAAAAELERSAAGGDASHWLRLIDHLCVLHAEVRQQIAASDAHIPPCPSVLGERS